jgi:glycosyltransferase involved in cell wall biosynthesis
MTFHAKLGQRICIVPRLKGIGGMVSFQEKLIRGLSTRGIEVCMDLDDEPYQAVLVVGGSRQILRLQRAHRRGIPIVHRLDGMNWLHRQRWTGLRHFLRSEYGNVLLRLIRDRLATHVIYQSHFAKDWWERKYGSAPGSSSVIYNGVDLNTYSPFGESSLPENYFRILMVEGNLRGGYEIGVEHAYNMALKLMGKLEDEKGKLNSTGLELMVVGQVPPDLKDMWDNRISRYKKSKRVRIEWFGEAAPQKIPEIDRSAHLLYSADINAACPNSVIEAMACGTPILAFDTGSLPELVKEEAGLTVPYGGDPWRLEGPDFSALAQAAYSILEKLESYRSGARARAEATFGLKKMVSGYLDALLGKNSQRN